MMRHGVQRHEAESPVQNRLSDVADASREPLIGVRIRTKAPSGGCDPKRRSICTVWKRIKTRRSRTRHL